MTADLSSVLELVAKATAAELNAGDKYDCQVQNAKVIAAFACFDYLRTHAAELSAMQKDAERLDWLLDRTRSVDLYNFLQGKYDRNQDHAREAIDAAIRSERGEG